MHVVFSRLELAGLVSNNENSYEVSSDYSSWVYSSLPRREVTVFDKKGSTKNKRPRMTLFLV